MVSHSGFYWSKIFRLGAKDDGVAVASAGPYANHLHLPLDSGLYKPRTGHTGRTGRWMNHAPAILAAPALIYSMHRLLVIWIIVVHFHLCSLLNSYTALEVWAVWRSMRVCYGSRQGRCLLFTNILHSLTAHCLVYNTAMYTVCGQYGWCMFIYWPVRPVRGFYGPLDR